VPPAGVRRHFDFFDATWEYPYDMYFMPFYPAHAVDNGPQDVTAPAIARAWNARFAYPRMIVATPSEFFAACEARYADSIPGIRGELPGFWGNQVFFSIAQADPEMERGQREFERRAGFFEGLAPETCGGFLGVALGFGVKRAAKPVLGSRHPPFDFSPLAPRFRRPD